MKPIKPIKLFFLFFGLWVCQSLMAAPSFPVDSIPKEWLKSGFKQHDFSMYIRVEEILKQTIQKNDYILIDVRAAEEYQKVRIPDSLNIPLFAVKTKTYLKPKSIVLFNEGYAWEALETECRRLKELGFNVKILTGGLNAWKNKGGEFAGDTAALEGIDRIPARDFFIEKNYQNWTVINTSSVVSADARLWVPFAVHIPFKNEKQFTALLGNLLAKEKTAPNPWLIILNENGKEYKAIEQTIQKKQILNLFFLKNGLAGYKEFLDQQNPSKNNKGPAKTSTAKCPTCPN
ncbi:MAG: rhodanese-like domain-containing protein [Desulfobacteraceae bacterium]|nr:MAG: rhodanese-like domain-containing protein [Desulfobacteraceae bacterium]